MWCSHRWLKSLFNSNEDKHLQEHPTREREKEREKETERKRQRERDRERSSNRGGFARLVILVSPGMQGQGVLSKALATGRTHVGLLARVEPGMKALAARHAHVGLLAHVAKMEQTIQT